MGPLGRLSPGAGQQADFNPGHQIAGSTRSALLKHPGTGYVISEFEQHLQPTIGGIRQSGEVDRIKVVSSARNWTGSGC